MRCITEKSVLVGADFENVSHNVGWHSHLITIGGRWFVSETLLQDFNAITSQLHLAVNPSGDVVPGVNRGGQVCLQLVYA
ncbi:hypothetical protein PF001_g14257 [Phytophthora fragariae]|uniref:Uncharacterized protein n=1 Tax=Phytophthora fragariae TaxID=53985 RepID=A0A6A4D8H3_9STRA|nr:hypothetical protein PF001_g14257 [Phytophthora fragariae]